MIRKKRKRTEKNPEDNAKNPVIENPNTDLADSYETARNRYERWKNEDPFPSISPALLNSADILSYINAVSLIYPFYKEDLSGASYDVRIKGKVVYYEADDKNEILKIEKDLLNDGDSFDLLPNSIAFVTLEPAFRIPDYLALRFNLKITHIYKGLLLGTGPLVDPGFVGKLSIPLHNLTNNTYRFFKGDKLITMEFTKMSNNICWKSNKEYIIPTNDYIPSSIPSDRPVDKYIAKALEKDRLKHVVSSIPAAMQESKNDVKEAKDAVKAYEKRSIIQTTISILAVVSITLTLISISIGAINKANERYDELNKEYHTFQEEYSKKYDELLQKIDDLTEEIESTNSAIKP